MRKVQWIVVWMLVSACLADPWDSVRSVLNNAIQDGAFPGCVATGFLFAEGFGHFTYGVPPPENPNNPRMELTTLFDMASLTKVTSTTSAVMQFYQRGELDLDTLLVSNALLGPLFATGDPRKKTMSVRHCLLHDSGFPPDPVPFYSTPQFGCPETGKPQPQQSFSCKGKITKAWLSQTLENPVGKVYVYSDLNFITLMYVVGHLAKTHGYVHEADLVSGCAVDGSIADYPCYYEAYVRKHVFASPDVNMNDTGFLPPRVKWPRAAPTENDTVYLHRVIQGEVSDGNAFALGGIAGHAGLFSSAHDVAKLLRRYLAPVDTMFNATTVKTFTTVFNLTQSTRALGWDTNAVPHEPPLGCGSLSPTTFGHTGYTGGEICVDPERGIFTNLLTNRVYPTPSNHKILDVRPLFNGAVQKVVDAMKKQG